MTDYSDYGLDQYLQPSSPFNTMNFISGYQFDSTTDRTSITNTKIANISADKVTAGTVIVGINVGAGTNNAYLLLDGANNRIVVNDGTTNRIVIGNI